MRLKDVIAVIRAGARGYVTKSISADELVVAIQRVAEGDAVFSPRLAGLVLDAFAGGAEQGIDPELDQLTPREREVLRLIARGYAYKEVALELSISIKTVETHVSAVLRKLQLSKPTPAHALGDRSAPGLGNVHRAKPPNRQEREHAKHNDRANDCGFDADHRLARVVES